MSASDRSARSGGSQARRAARAASSARPIWHGMEGGRYKPLSDDEVGRIHETSLDLLENVGVDGPDDAWRDRVVAAGGWMDGERLCFPRALVEECLKITGRGFTLFGRTLEHDLDVSGTRTHFGGASTTVQILDPHTNEFRNTTLLDLYDASRLQDRLDTTHFINRAVIPRDVADPRDLDINMAYAVMASTNKHLMISFHQADHVDDVVAMFDMSLGGDGSGELFRQRPFATPVVTAIVSPMRFAIESCQVLDAAVRHGMPAVMCTAPLAGATGPASITGTLAQGNAETLAGIVAINLLSPGYPVLMGNVPFVADLRSGAFLGGSEEAALLGAGAARMANFYDIPSWIANGITSANQPDVQSGWEKGYLVALVALAGGSLLSQSSGALSNLIACSLEAFVLRFGWRRSAHRARI